MLLEFSQTSAKGTPGTKQLQLLKVQCQWHQSVADQEILNRLGYTDICAASKRKTWWQLSLQR